VDKQTKQLVITGGLVAVLIFSLLGSLKKKPAKQVAPAQPLTQANAPAPTISSPAGAFKPSDELTQQLERLKLSWGRDPFTFGLDKGFQIGELKLKGISFGKDRGGFAFINDEIVKKGDTIGEYEIVDVQKDRVFLKRGTQSFYLMFPEE
jgi:hypothetical protein